MSAHTRAYGKMLKEKQGPFITRGVQKIGIDEEKKWHFTPKVKVGDKVTHWQEIASVGTTGYSTGNHLHYELRRNGNYVNPLPYMGLGNEHFPILSGMSNYLLE